MVTGAVQGSQGSCCKTRQADLVVVLQTWKSQGSESGIAPIMRRLESRIGPLRTEAVQQSPPWVATSPDLFESCAPFRSFELFSKPAEGSESLIGPHSPFSAVDVRVHPDHAGHLEPLRR